MNAERAREFLLGLPHVVETEQWGGLVFWVGDRAVGGKMFVMMNLGASSGRPAAFPAGEERFHELCEREGIVPAPYLARIFWVAVDEWGVLRDHEWKEELNAAHAIIFAKLPKKVRGYLELPAGELKRLVVARRKVLALKEAAKRNARRKGSSG